MTLGSPANTSISDEQLAQQVAGGGAGIATAAFEQIYRRHARGMLAFIASRTAAADCEDVFQLVWLKIWKSLPEKFTGGSLRGWIYQIARNCLIDHHRAARPGGAGAAADVAVEDDAPTALLHRERMQALEDCLTQLSPAESDVIRGLLGGQGYSQLCTQLEINANVAYKTAGRAKTKLKDCVEAKLA